MNTLELAQKLAEARELVEQAVVKNCPIPVFYADKEGHWCRVNAPLERLFAVEETELLSNKWQKFLMAKSFKKDWEAAVRTKDEHTKLHIRAKAADGRIFSAYCNLVRLTNGGMIGFIVPICEHPNGCPVHGFLLHNIDGGSDATQVPG